MSPRKLVPLLVAAGLLPLVGAYAQTANSEYKISKIAPDYQDSPGASGSFNKRVSRPKKWLEVEVSFDWQPRLKEPKFTDELTVNYYILLNNANATLDRKPTLLTGSVTHVNIPQERDLKSVMYIAPRTLEKFFNGSAPPNAGAAVFDIGVTISQGGQVVAESSLKGRGQWWTQYTATPGFVVNKDETPFSALAWDYYEAIKSKSTGN